MRARGPWLASVLWGAGCTATVTPAGDAAARVDGVAAAADVAPPDATALADATTFDATDVPAVADRPHRTDLPDVADVTDARFIPFRPDVPTSPASPFDPPRQVWPLSGLRLTSHRPRLEWAPAAGATGAHVEICRDRACADVAAAFDATGTSAPPPSPLSRGTFWWRLTALVGAERGSVAGPLWSFTTWSRDVAVDTGWPVGADFDGDGYADAAVALATAFDVIYGGPANAFRRARGATLPPVAYPFRSGLVPAGDLDGDGFGDLLVVRGGRSVELYLGGPTGLDTTPRVTLSSTFFDLEPSDDDNADGYVDFFRHRQEPGIRLDLQWNYGGPAGLDLRPARVTPYPTSTDLFDVTATWSSLGDVNGDRRVDHLYTASLGGTVSVAYLGGGGSRTLAFHGQSGRAAAYAMGDLDGDGYCDAFAHFVQLGDEPGASLPYRGSAAGFVDGAGGAWTFDRASYAFGLGDLNGDGNDDYFLGAQGVDDRGPSFSNDGRLIYGARPALPTPVIYVGGLTRARGDFNGDGYDDLLYADPPTGTVRVTPGGPTGPGAAVVIPPP